MPVPIYPGVELRFGDHYLIPGTGETGMKYSEDLIPQEDMDRIDKLVGSWNTNYIIRPYSQSDWRPKEPTLKPATNKSLTTANKQRNTLEKKIRVKQNSWINKRRGIWNYNGVSLADVANAYKTGDFSKVSNYLTQHKDLANYLNGVYGKRGGNQFGIPKTPTVDVKGLSDAISNMSVPTVDQLTRPTGITPTVNIPTSPLPTLYNRSLTRDYMRSLGMNPYDYSGAERKALRAHLNAPGAAVDSKYLDFINLVLNKLYSRNLFDSVGSTNITNPTNTPVKTDVTQDDLDNLNKNYLNATKDNNLVSLKFKQGGQMYKYQQGGQAQLANGQQGMEQLAIALVQAAMLGDLLANLTIQLIMLAAQLGDQQALQVAQLLQAIILKMKGSRKARLGAKLNYIKLSIGECPKGLEVVYFKKGGEICKVCSGKKMLNGGKPDPIKEFKNRKRALKK